MEMRTGGEVEVFVEADPRAVYAVVSDVTRTGEWSPECRRCRWLDGVEGPAVGARFRGWNRWRFNRWSRVCEVIEAEPGREFAFRTVPGRGGKNDSTIWRFRFDNDGDGTRLAQSYEIVDPPKGMMQRFIPRFVPHHLDMRPHMQESLGRIKAIVEQASAARPT